MNRLFSSIALSSIAFSWLVVSQVFAVTTVSPSDSNILYTGRFDQSIPSQPVFGWSGTSIIANFEGTSLTARFDDEGDNHLYYIIDDGEPLSLNLNSSPRDYLLASGLADGVHKVEIGKKTEGTMGEVKFLNLKIDDGKSLAPAPTRPPLKFVFFGDSNQAGYSAECICDSGDAKYEDSFYAYPGITSRMLNAEYHNISAGGITISHSWNIRDIWNKTYYGGGNGPAWGFASEEPDAVIINLGANDLYAGQNKSQIKNGWKNFISNELRGVYPNAHIVLANSYGWAINEPANYVHEAVDELHNAGDTKVSFVRFPWLWSQAHAVTFEHAGFANILAKHLADQLDIPQPAPNSLSSFATPGQVPNGSFEDSNLQGVPSGWRFQGNGNSHVESATDAHSGSDYISVAGSNSFFWHATDAIPGHEYELAGWMREGGSGNTGKLQIQFKDQAQQVISTFEESQTVAADWKQVTLRATAPAGAWQIAVSVLAGGGSHTIDFDDLSLRDLDAPPIAPADFDRDGDVDSEDLGIWSVAYDSNVLADADEDGDTDGRDFLVWQRNYNPNGSISALAVPEASTWTLLIIAYCWSSNLRTAALR